MKGFIFIIISIIFVTSCSVNYHLKKAMNKGYSVGESSDTIRISTIDSFPIIVHDSIVWQKVITQKDTIIRYRVPQVPKTRFQIRFDKKKFSDSLGATVKMHRVSAKENVKSIKQETRQVRHKNKRKANLFLFGLVTGVILTFIIRYAINQALKKFT